MTTMTAPEVTTGASTGRSAGGKPVGVELDGAGAHPAAWRFADHTPVQAVDPRRLAEAARVAEDAGFEFIWLAASRPWDATPARRRGVRARLDPVETASFLAASTTRIGLVAETTVAGAEPFHLANRLASLDWAAQGRAGWAPVWSSGRPAPEGAAEGAEHAEVVDAVRALWDTWEDGVFLADESTGRFLDLDRWHYADFQGEHFSVKGPSITPRPPQGHLPVLGRGPGVDLVRVGGTDPVDAAARADAARASGARVLLDVEVLLDADRPAAERLAALDAHDPWEPTDRLRLVGSPAEVAETLVGLSAHVDAIRLDPAVLTVDLPVLAAHVLPALAGTSRSSAARSSEAALPLRDGLGLPPAGNRFADRRTAQEARATSGGRAA
jgi:alkanesulfonate monooxygenase SsuD/methylene tetrahydromethanopterin reductase-like flavin-dependent oxidoreductase (luciferase family)